jgi:hypothetical protein
MYNAIDPIDTIKKMKVTHKPMISYPKEREQRRGPERCIPSFAVAGKTGSNRRNQFM